jgi:hypothetical protein
MVDKRVLEEVKYRRALGRADILGIKRELFLQGYKPRDIDEAVAEVYKKELRDSKKPINPNLLPNRIPVNPYARINPMQNTNLNPKKKIVISTKAIIITIVIIALVVVLFFLIRSLKNSGSNGSEEPTGQITENNVEIANLALSIKEFASEIPEGGELPFSILIENKEYADSVNLSVKIEISDIKGKAYLDLNKEEFITLTSETSEVIYSRSLDTSSLKEGNYKMKISVGNTQEKKNIIKYFAVSKNYSVSISPITQAKSCKLDSQCDDNNPCTQDQCVSDICIFSDVLQCCGNFICEANEDESVCSVDCKSQISINSTSDQDLIQRALAKAKSNPSLASQFCSFIKDIYNKDVCYSQIALNSSRSQFCSQIQNQDSKDNCYLSLTTKTNQLCDKIQDLIKKETCESLADI